jgi:hypothetical protein
MVDGTALDGLRGQIDEHSGLLVTNPFNLVSRDRHLFEASDRTTEVRLVDSFPSAAGISLPAEFALGRERSRALFAGSRVSLGDFLTFAGETRLGHAGAIATGAFRTALAAIGFSFVCITFAGPLILNHGATRARRQRRCCSDIFSPHNS